MLAATPAGLRHLRSLLRRRFLCDTRRTRGQSEPQAEAWSDGTSYEALPTIRSVADPTSATEHPVRLPRSYVAGKRRVVGVSVAKTSPNRRS